MQTTWEMWVRCTLKGQDGYFRQGYQGTERFADHGKSLQWQGHYIMHAMGLPDPSMMV
jgi:hypothetical protein